MGFLVELEDGRKLEFEKKPTPEAIDYAIKDLGQKSPQRISGSGLPLEGNEIYPFQAVDKMISERKVFTPEDALQAFARVNPNSNVVLDTARRAGSGLLNTAAMVGQRSESAVANPLLNVQRGNFSPKDAFEAFRQGVTGEKPGEIGDIIRSTGLLPESLSATIGFTGAAISPAAVIKGVDRYFKGVSKLTDKAIKTNGAKIIGAADEAKNFVGSLTDEAYNSVKNFSVTKMDDFVPKLKKLPSNLLDNIADDLGVENIDDFLENMNVGKLRKLKQELGKYKASAFGRSERGLADNVDSEKVNKAYSAMIRTLRGSVEDAMSEGGKVSPIAKKKVQQLIDADNKFSELVDAVNLIKKNLVDPTTKKATRAGRLIKKVQKDLSDTALRDSLEVVRKTSKKANKQIRDAINNLNKFYDKQEFNSMLGELGRNISIGITSGVGAGAVFRALNQKE